MGEGEKHRLEVCGRARFRVGSLLILRNALGQASDVCVCVCVCVGVSVAGVLFLKERVCRGNGEVR